MPLVSVILPNFNHQNYLVERLESILNQSFTNFEVIILDDCSTDNSILILEKYKKHPKISQYLLNKKNTGSTFSQWNKGVSLAKGKYIWIAESDDIANLKFLEKLVPILEKNKNLSLAFCQSYEINSNSEIVGDWLTWTDIFHEKNIFTGSFFMNGFEFIRNFMLYRNVIPNASAVLFRKKNYNEIGGAVKYLKAVGDWNVWVKLLSKGGVYFTHEKLNYFRRHPQSVIASLDKIKNNIDIRINTSAAFSGDLYIFFKERGDVSLHQLYKKIYYLDSSKILTHEILRLNLLPLLKNWQILSLFKIDTYIYFNLRIFILIYIVISNGIKYGENYEYLIRKKLLT